MKSLTPAKLTVFMLVAVGGLITAYVAKGLLATEERIAKPATRTIPMALANLKPGTVITEAHVGAGEVSLSELQSETLLNERAIVGRIVKAPIAAATPIVSSQLYLPGEFPPLDVSAGMRAVAVSLAQSVSMVNGLIQPGQYVDVHWTPSGVDQNDPRFRGGLTLTLFKGVKLLTINRDSQGSGDRVGNAVTLELVPEQANIMILAREKGDITLTYNPQGKGKGSIAVSSEDRATLDELLGLKPLPTPKTFVTDNYRGASHSTLEFRDGKRQPATAADDAPATDTAPAVNSVDDSVSVAPRITPGPKAARSQVDSNKRTTDRRKAAGR